MRGLYFFVGLLMFSCTSADVKEGLVPVYSKLFLDSTLWEIEAQTYDNSHFVFYNNTLEIDAHKGVTVWFKTKLQGECVIEYDITVIDNGGPNDRVSDMNCFWMFSDPHQPDQSLAFSDNSRQGIFKNYNTLQGYYVGLGGHNNTRTRFRRYDGNFERELLPAHDLSAKEFLIIPNQKYHITLVARGSKVQYWRDNHLLFDYRDKSPYTEGWFAFRTVNNHMLVENMMIYTSKH